MDLAKIDSDVNPNGGDPITFALEPAHCLLVAV
jgi:hypothetical protein